MTETKRTDLPKTPVIIRDLFDMSAWALLWIVGVIWVFCIKSTNINAIIISTLLVYLFLIYFFARTEFYSNQMVIRRALHFFPPWRSKVIPYNSISELKIYYNDAPKHGGHYLVIELKNKKKIIKKLLESDHNLVAIDIAITVISGGVKTEIGNNTAQLKNINKNVQAFFGDALPVYKVRGIHILHYNYEQHGDNKYKKERFIRAEKT